MTGCLPVNHRCRTGFYNNMAITYKLLQTGRYIKISLQITPEPNDTPAPGQHGKAKNISRKVADMKTGLSVLMQSKPEIT